MVRDALTGPHHERNFENIELKTIPVALRNEARRAECLEG